MVTLNRIYTKTGDKGTTALGSGERVEKYSLRVEAYGTVDEANSAIGLARLHTKTEAPEIDKMLGRIQNDLFDLGADLSTPHQEGVDLGYEPLRITASQVEKIEANIDQLNESLEPLKSFVLPGGSPAAAYLHLARTVVRRAERLTVQLSDQENEIVSEECVKYLNRLSDLLFVASRSVNDNGNADILWVPGKNR